MLSCKRYAALLAPFAEDDLPEPDRGSVAAHVAACASCREAVETHRIVAALLSTHRPAAPEPPADLWSRIEAQIAPTGSAAAPAARSARPAHPWLSALPRPRFRIAAMPTAAGLVAAGLTFLFLFTGTNDSAVATRRAVRHVLVTLVGPSLESADHAAGSPATVNPTAIIEAPKATAAVAAAATRRSAPLVKKQAAVKAQSSDPFQRLEERRSAKAPSRIASAVAAASASGKGTAPRPALYARVASRPSTAEEAAALDVSARSVALSTHQKAEPASSGQKSVALLDRNSEAASAPMGDVPAATGDAAPVHAPKDILATSGPQPAPGHGSGIADAAPPDAALALNVRPAAAPTSDANEELSVPGKAVEDASPVRAYYAPTSVLTASQKGPTARTSAVDAATRANRQRTLFSYGNR